MPILPDTSHDFISSQNLHIMLEQHGRVEKVMYDKLMEQKIQGSNKALQACLSLLQYFFMLNIATPDSQ